MLPSAPPLTGQRVGFPPGNNFVYPIGNGSSTRSGARCRFFAHTLFSLSPHLPGGRVEIMYWEIRQARCHIMVVALLVAVLGGTLSCRAAEQEQEQESGGETVVAIIHLRHRPAAGVLPAVRAALSPAGRASVDRVGNGIVVNDTAGRVERIRTLVRGLDVRVPQVTVL
ncbi:MAG TPA: hypothetical protein ENK27_00160, partial [Desulfobulbus sp.]|nr:hypothetical protein [Desulfobulbus sp.]